jgi:hypothetical protein
MSLSRLEKKLQQARDSCSNHGPGPRSPFSFLDKKGKSASPQKERTVGSVDPTWDLFLEFFFDVVQRFVCVVEYVVLLHEVDEFFVVVQASFDFAV